MAKTVLPSKFQEWKGLDRISLAVHEMHCIFREITKDDFGIDGEIEIVVPKADGPGFQTTGGIIKVQAKSGESYVKQDSETNFSTPVEKNDLETWYNATYPTLFIVYHPKDDKLYCKEVKSYVRSTPNVFQPPLRIVFNKATDEFTSAWYSQICQIAQVSPPRISRQQQEKLYSNLFLVKRFPRVITYASTGYKKREDVWVQIQGSTPPFCIVEDHLYTLSDLRNSECSLRDFCDTTNIHDLLTEKWIGSNTHRRDYNYLLNQLLGIHLRRCGLKYDRDFERNYFPRQDEQAKEFKRDWFNVRTGRLAPPRIIAKYYEYGLDKFWRHLAADMRFKFFGSSLYLQLIPRYFFTYDGKTPYESEKVGPYSTKLKAKERNSHVLNHILFWADILSQGTPNIELKLDFKTVVTIEKLPQSGIADFAIVDDPAIYEEEDDAGQTNFFDILFGMSRDGDEYEF